MTAQTTVYLSEFLGTPVFDSTGTKIGRVAEVAVQPGAYPPRVSMLLVKDGKERGLRSVRWDQLLTVEPNRISLRVAGETLAVPPSEESYLMLRKDLLDQQIIDVNGRKVVRVNDLLLERRPADAGPLLQLAAVDIGLRGAVRRLLQGAVPRTLMRQLEAGVKDNIIPWDFVDLIQSDPRRQVKLHISHKALTNMHPADLADIVEELSPKERHALFVALDDVTVAEALSEVRPNLRASILESLGIRRAADVVEEMPPDAAADVLAQLPEETAAEVLQDMNREEAAEIGELLEFPQNSAGGMMTTEYVALPHTADVEAARALLRGIPDLPDNFTTLFLIDEGGTFMGSVSLARLTVAAQETKLVTLIHDPLLFVPQDSTEKDVVGLFDKYNLLSLAVVDEQEQLIGAVTVDDVISVLNKR
jgi:CBS domain-containing protein/sporulation protein YlmC with PRC-barrel domain